MNTGDSFEKVLGEIGRYTLAAFVYSRKCGQFVVYFSKKILFEWLPLRTQGGPLLPTTKFFTQKTTSPPLVPHCVAKSSTWPLIFLCCLVSAKETTCDAKHWLRGKLLGQKMWSKITNLPQLLTRCLLHLSPPRIFLGPHIWLRQPPPPSFQGSHLLMEKHLLVFAMRNPLWSDLRDAKEGIMRRPDI